MAAINNIYIGTREAMIAEAAAFDPVVIGEKPASCRYLVMMSGDLGEFDTEWFSTIKEARAHAKYLAAQYKAPIAYIV